MLAYCIVFIVITSGLTSADDICSRDPSSVCDSQFSLLFFPKTAVEFRIICRIVVKTLQCGIDYYEKCHYFPVAIEEIYKGLAAIYEMCDPWNKLNKAIVEKLECFHNEIVADKSSNCFEEELPEETLEMQAEALYKEDHQEIKEDEVDDYRCLKVVNGIACRALETKEKCGTEAINAFVEVAVKFSHVSSVVCASHVAELLPAVIRLREIENDVQQERKNMIPRIEKK